VKGGWLLTGLKVLSSSQTAKHQIPVISEEDVVKSFETKEPVVVLDVRTEKEFTGPLGHIKGSKHIPVDQLETRLSELGGDKEKVIITTCHSGTRSDWAAKILVKAGFTNVMNMKGGMSTWSGKNLPVER